MQQKPYLKKIGIYKIIFPLAAALILISTSAKSLELVDSVHFSGQVFSSTGVIPEKLSVLADCQDQRERILGKIEGGRYHIDLPPGITCSIVIAEYEWDSDPQPVFDARTAIPLPVLVYPRQVPEPNLARELLEMGRQDSVMRRSWANERQNSTSTKQMQTDDSLRQKRLMKIIEKKGWPTHSMVGAQAARGAWLIAQHSPAEQLRHWLELMQKAARKHEINLSNLATSIDRVLVNDNKMQIYGTQYRKREDGVIEPKPIEDFANIDARRFSMGMSSYAQYLEVIQSSPP